MFFGGTERRSSGEGKIWMVKVHNNYICTLAFINFLIQNMQSLKVTYSSILWARFMLLLTAYKSYTVQRKENVALFYLSVLARSLSVIIFVPGHSTLTVNNTAVYVDSFFTHICLGNNSTGYLSECNSYKMFAGVEFANKWL